MSHKVVVVPQSGVPDEPMPDAAKPPILVDDEKVVQGTRNILAYLEELKGFKELWYKYQSDTCYCD